MPTTNGAECWAAEVLYLIDQLDGGLLQKLDSMIADVPAGVEFFPAFRRVMDRLGVSESLTPVGDARHTFAARLGARGDSAGTSAAMLVDRMLARVGELIDAGSNDAADPLVRASDFALVGVDQFGRRVGYARQLSPAARAALAGVEPVTLTADGPGYVLGDPRKPLYRRGEVRRLTDAARRQVEDRRAEQEREAAAAPEAAARRLATDPTFQASRLAELERQVATLTANGGKP